MDVVDFFVKGFLDFEDYFDVIFGVGIGCFLVEVEDEFDFFVWGDDVSCDSRVYEILVLVLLLLLLVCVVEDFELVVYFILD